MFCDMLYAETPRQYVSDQHLTVCLSVACKVFCSWIVSSVSALQPSVLMVTVHIYVVFASLLYYNVAWDVSWDLQQHCSVAWNVLRDLAPIAASFSFVFGHPGAIKHLQSLHIENSCFIILNVAFKIGLFHYCGTCSLLSSKVSIFST